MTELVDFIDIDKNSKQIAEYILKNKSYIRNNKMDMKLKKYDIEEISKYLIKEVYI